MYFWSLDILQKLHFLFWAYQLPNSNAKTRPEDSRICLSYVVFSGSVVFWTEKVWTSFLIIDLSGVPKYMLSLILLLELSNVFSIMIIWCFRVWFYGVGDFGKLNPTDLYINGGRGIPIPNHIVLRWGVKVEFAPTCFQHTTCINRCQVREQSIKICVRPPCSNLRLLFYSRCFWFCFLGG